MMHAIVKQDAILNETFERLVADRAATIRECEHRFHEIAEVSGDWTWETDREHRFTMVLGEAVDALPLPSDDLLGKTRWEAASADLAKDEFWARHKADLEAHRPFRRFRYVVTTPAGGCLYILSSGGPVFDAQHIFLGYRGTSTDVTAFVEARQRAEQAETLLRDAIESIAGGIAIYDTEDRLVLCNDSYRRLYSENDDHIVPGVRYEDVLRSGLARGQYPDAVGHEDDWIAEHLCSDPMGAVEQQLDDGRWVLVTKRRMTNGWAAGLRIDVTALKTAQTALSEGEGQLRRAQRIAHMGSDFRNLITDEAGWSDECYRIFGVSRETFVPTTENFLHMVHPDDRGTIVASRDLASAGISPLPFEYRVIRPDGTVRYVYRESELIRDGAGKPLILAGIIHDITEPREAQKHGKELEQQLAQAQKMEAIGNLTGGMAHDFNNLLGVIIGNLDLLGDVAADNSDIEEFRENALDAALRGADLTRRLLAFARRQALRPERLDANTLIAEITKLLRRTLGEHIRIELRLAADLWPVVVDPAQLESAITNLANNARDAMPGGGRLLITTRNTHLDEDYAADHSEVKAGDYMLIEVTDTGTGMPRDIVSRIFDPFFTTKEPGKGTGLGLSMVFGFIRQSDGHISVYSEPGSGTTFRLYLRRGPAGPTEPRETTAAKPVAGNGETILVVEDSPQLLSLVGKQLIDLGYRVLKADGPEAALDILAGHEPIQLLLTDIVMPGGMSGLELARGAIAQRAQLKVLLTSGFPAMPSATDGAMPSGWRLLTKPYRRAELARLVRETLDAID
jgi:PAS domain S-box-containing protein